LCYYEKWCFQIFGGIMSRKEPKQFYSAIDQITDNQEFIASIKEGFGEVDDPRMADNQTYPLVSLLIMILCAILAGANTICDIHTYSKVKREMFKRLLSIGNTPSYNVFWWLLTRLNPEQLESCFIHWIQSLPEGEKDRLIAVDGKHVRGASRLKKIHLVSAWDSHRSLLLGQVKANEKSNEITAIPELLKSIDIKDATVTIDAAGCYTSIVETIRGCGGHYFIALK
jgi:hypothetical protein